MQLGWEVRHDLKILDKCSSPIEDVKSVEQKISFDLDFVAVFIEITLIERKEGGAP